MPITYVMDVTNLASSLRKVASEGHAKGHIIVDSVAAGKSAQELFLMIEGQTPVLVGEIEKVAHFKDATIVIYRPYPKDSKVVPPIVQEAAKVEDIDSIPFDVRRKLQNTSPNQVAIILNAFTYDELEQACFSVGISYNDLLQKYGKDSVAAIGREISPQRRDCLVRFTLNAYLIKPNAFELYLR